VAAQISQVSASLERVASQAAYAQAGRNSVGEATTMHLDPDLGGEHVRNTELYNLC
jgi:hypothetical protein